MSCLYNIKIELSLIDTMICFKEQLDNLKQSYLSKNFFFHRKAGESIAAKLTRQSHDEISKATLL